MHNENIHNPNLTNGNHVNDVYVYALSESFLNPQHAEQEQTGVTSLDLAIQICINNSGPRFDPSNSQVCNYSFINTQLLLLI